MRKVVDDDVGVVASEWSSAPMRRSPQCVQNGPGDSVPQDGHEKVVFEAHDSSAVGLRAERIECGPLSMGGRRSRLDATNGDKVTSRGDDAQGVRATARQC